jgi:hypothetical protein
VIAHNLIGYTQDAAIKFRTVDGRIVGSRGGASRWNKVLNNIFYRCGKAIDFANRDNTAEGNLYLRDWGEVGDESQPVGRGLNWIPDAGAATLRLDLDAWQKFFGFDKTGAYADMSIDVDLDALAMTWSFAGPAPQVPTGKHFLRDLIGESAGPLRPPGPLLHLPDSSTRVTIDPRRLVH